MMRGGIGEGKIQGGERKERTKKKKKKLKSDETLYFNWTRLFIHSHDLFTLKVSPLAIFI